MNRHQYIWMHTNTWSRSQYVRKEKTVNPEADIWERSLSSSIISCNSAHPPLSSSSLDYRGSRQALQSLHLLSVRLSDRSRHWDAWAHGVVRAAASCPWQQGFKMRALADVKSAVVSRHFSGNHPLQCWLSSNPRQELLECSTHSTSLVARATLRPKWVSLWLLLSQLFQLFCKHMILYSKYLPRIPRMDSVFMAKLSLTY